MFLLGLTGSIGMGKSTAARMFAARGVPVHDADAAVHDLYEGAAVSPIGEVFPEAISDGRVNRDRLSRLVIGKPDALRRLEDIVHPLVREAGTAFLERAAHGGASMAILEVPLLLESGGRARVDAVVVVSAGPVIQRQRVLAREGMTEEKFAAILARQMPDEDKRRQAHFIIDSSGGFEWAEKQVDDILRALAGAQGNAYARSSQAASGG